MSYPAEQAPAEVLLVEDYPGGALIIQEAFGEHAIRNVLHVVTDGEQALQSPRQPPGRARKLRACSKTHGY